MKPFRSLLGALVLLAAAVPAVALDFPKPEAEITSFRLEAITLRDVTFSFELTIKNPYPVELPVAGLTLDFLVEGAKVFHAENQGKLDIPAKKKKASSFTVTLPYEGIASAVKDYLSKDWLQTVVEGKLTIALPKITGLPKTVSFDYKLNQKIPAVKPEVSILNFSVEAPSEEVVVAAVKKAAKKIDAKDALAGLKAVLAGKKPEKGIQPQDLDLPLTLTYTVAVENKAKAPLGFLALGYGLFVNGQSLAAGQSTDIRQEGTKTLVTIATTFRSGQLSEGLQAVFRDRKGQFRVTGTAELQVPPEIRKEPVPLSFDESGDFRF